MLSQKVAAAQHNMQILPHALLIHVQARQAEEHAAWPAMMLAAGDMLLS